MTRHNRDVRISAQVEGAVIEGRLHLGYKTRVSDVLNEDAQFLILVDVTRRPGGEAEAAEHHDILILRKGEIKHVIPFD